MKRKGRPPKKRRRRAHAVALADALAALLLPAPTLGASMVEKPDDYQHADLTEPRVSDQELELMLQEM